MADDVTGRLTELWEAFKRLQESTPGLEVGAGRFVLIPPAGVRLTGFRARLEQGNGGRLATLLVDTEAARIGVRKSPDASEDDVATQWLSVDLSAGFRLDSQVMKHPTVMARALLDRLEQAVQEDGSKNETR